MNIEIKYLHAAEERVVKRILDYQSNSIYGKYLNEKIKVQHYYKEFEYNFYIQILNGININNDIDSSKIDALMWYECNFIEPETVSDLDKVRKYLKKNFNYDLFPDGCVEKFITASLDEMSSDSCIKYVTKELNLPNDIFPQLK